MGGNLDLILSGLLFSLTMFALSVNVTSRGLSKVSQNDTASAPSANSMSHGNQTTHRARFSLELVLAIVLFGILACVVILKVTKLLREKKDMKKNLQCTPKTIITSLTEVKQGERNQDLVFFVEEEHQFNLENLLDAGADMQSQNFCSSLYRVQLNNGAYAVKRLRKLQASKAEFERTMAKVGKISHPNILPLVAYSCQGEEKLLIYKYQNKGSLLSLMESKLPAIMLQSCSCI